MDMGATRLEDGDGKTSKSIFKDGKRLNFADNGSITLGNQGTVAKISEEERFGASRGHGFAAERANHLYDKLTGHDANLVGDGNAKNGADRIVDGVSIQSKYCKTGSKCISECFDKKREFPLYGKRKAYADRSPFG